MSVFTINFYSVFFWAFLIYWFPIKDIKKRLILLCIIFIQFTILAWQRDFEVGQDTLQYYYAFNQLAHAPLSEIALGSWEPGYLLWNWIISHLGFDYHAYLLFTAIFIYFSFCRFVYRYSDCAWLSVIVFIAFGYYFGSLHILRQYLALSIVLFSYDFILKRRLLPFILLVLLAFSFHSSAIAFLPTYFICRLRLKKTTLFIAFCSSVTLAFIGGYALFNSLIANDRYTHYYINTVEANAGTGYSMLALLIAIIIIALIVKSKKFTDKERLFYWCFFIAVCAQPFAILVSMVSRGILYWLLSVAIILPMIIHNMKSVLFRIISYIIVVLGLIVFFEFVTNSNEGIERYATYRFYNPK